MATKPRFPPGRPIHTILSGLHPGGSVPGFGASEWEVHSFLLGSRQHPRFLVYPSLPRGRRPCVDDWDNWSCWPCPGAGTRLQERWLALGCCCGHRNEWIFVRCIQRLSSANGGTCHIAGHACAACLVSACRRSSEIDPTDDPLALVSAGGRYSYSEILPLVAIALAVWFALNLMTAAFCPAGAAGGGGGFCFFFFFFFFERRTPSHLARINKSIPCRRGLACCVVRCGVCCLCAGLRVSVVWACAALVSPLFVFVAGGGAAALFCAPVIYSIHNAREALLRRRLSFCSLAPRPCSISATTPHRPGRSARDRLGTNSSFELAESGGAGMHWLWVAPARALYRLENGVGIVARSRCGESHNPISARRAAHGGNVSPDRTYE